MLIVAYAPTAAAQEPPKNLTPEAEGRDGPGQGETDAPAPTGLSVTSSTANSVSLRWYSVTNAYRYKLERSTSSSGPWTDVGTETGDTSGTATGLDCGTTYHFRVSARGDGSPYSTTFGNPTSSVSRATSACSPTIGVDLQSPFVGQAVTMTVSTTGSSGTVSSYQWQEWSAGSWTDLGATTTSATRSESSSVAGYRSFRVVVAYTSGTPVESYAIAIQWREMSVGVSASPDFPQSGPAATSTVTLTATAEAPSGAVYQWQEWSSGAWTDLGATTTSATKEVTSATRGTRKFRVVVSHAVVPSAESEPVYVTRDEWAIVAAMVGELSAAVATSTAYTTAQDALLTCMSATSTTSTDPGPKSPSDSRAPTMPPAVTFATFDDVLASYTGDVKTRMEDKGAGGCATQSNAMFSTNESVARAELARLKAGNAVYAGLLDTPHGRQFEANVGDSTTLKLVAYVGATTFEPGVLTPPLYNASSDGGTGPRDGPPEDYLLATGFDCLPAGVDGTRLTLEHKIEVLNCLVFATPRDFWISQADNLLNDLRFSKWLEYGDDWSCTLFPDASDATCRKHDVAFASLQRWRGTGEVTEMDLAWNPRNKHLADAEFLIDLAKYDCQMPSNVGKAVCGLLRGGTGFGSLAATMHYGVNKINSPWPVTRHDVEHSEQFPRFMECEVPKITGEMSHNRNPHFEVSWNFDPGCVSSITVDSYIFCWTYRNFGEDYEHCPEVEGIESSMTLKRYFVSEVTLESVRIRPNDIAYQDLRYRLADLLLPGETEFYYVKQPIGLKY